MITITEIAATKIKNQLERRGKGIGIKVGVKTTGCSGLAYTLEYVDSVGPLQPDSVESNGVTIFVETKDQVYLEEVTLDWQKKGLNEGFEFINSIEAGRCGCGSSFRI